MKLTDLDIIVTAPPAPWLGRALLDSGETSNGYWHHRLGRMLRLLRWPDAMEAVIRDVFERYFAGENPENIERLFRRTYSSGFTQRLI